MSMHSDETPELRRERARQQRAEQPAGEGDPAADSTVQRYRYVYHALRTVPPGQPPADFAAAMERHTRDHAESAAFERWALVLLAAMAIAMLGVPGVAAAVGVLVPVASLLAGAPWSLLLAAGAGLVLAWAVDRWLEPGAARLPRVGGSP